MSISRRDFLRFCGLSAAAVGLSATDLIRLEEALASPTAPSIIWLQGSGCTGCSESFLNLISASGPQTAADVLINSVNLVYHPTLMALAGQDAVAQAVAAYEKGGYLLVVEGGVPTAFGGRACYAWTYNEQEFTFEETVLGLAAKAAGILCIGTCAAWGGIPAAPPNPAGVVGVKALTGRDTINIPGCPTHPDWIAWTVVQLLTNTPISVDGDGRPTQFFSATVHELCPRRGGTIATDTIGVDGACLMALGCRGPFTMSNCPQQKWNNQANWCIDANAPCIGCTEPGFPGTDPFYSPGI